MSTHDALRLRALAARTAGYHDAAVAAWRTLLDARPDDWRLALELKRDLKAGLHYPDSDPRFRRAARSMPDEQWLDHYGTLNFFHGADLEAIDERARALLVRWPEAHRLYSILGDVARQRREWMEAVHCFEAADRLCPAHPHYKGNAAAARRYAELARRPWPTAGAPYRAAIINLDRNPERMVEIARQFATSAVPRDRIAGVEGSRLPAAAVARLTGDKAAPRGTLGCFLGHMAAWEALLARGDPAGLVLEDDVIPLLDLPPTLAGFALPDGWDLCFVNDRLTPPRPGFGTVPLAQVMMEFHPEENAPGGDGYLISRAGAQALLHWVAADGMANDVDWRMLAYSLTAGEAARIPVHAHARREIDRLSARIPRADRLRAHVMYPALIRTVGISSDREDQNRLA